MASKKKPDPLPPSESDSSGSSSEESSEDDAVESPPRPSQTNPPAKKTIVSKSIPIPESRGRESSDSGSVDESSDEEVPSAVKPVKDIAPEPSADSVSDHDTAKASGKADDARKRVATGSETEDGKPNKRVRAPTSVPEKSKEDDETVILMGLLDYIEKGSDPFTDATGFYNFIEGFLKHHEGSQQLADTVRRLKKRYQSIVSKIKRGKVLLPQEGKRKTIFELSKKIWSRGREAKIDDSAIVSSDRKNSKKGQSSRKVLDFEPKPEIERLVGKSTELVNGHSINNLLVSCWKELQNDNRVGLELMKESLELIEPSKVRILEERWKKIEIAKLDILQKQKDLLQEQVEMVLDALKQQKK
ncbi:STOREKEEPER protein-like [Aristolochia californica]|uniref:STOREKEEPER protein-like n=1 Tax=Aristolochia californica TaxID=171875 RepID=UPI0035DFD9DC